MGLNLYNFFRTFLSSKCILRIVFSVILSIPSVGYGENFLCRPWSNVVTGIEIGDSFTSQIEDGTISFLGEQRPLAFAQLIYSHPLNDIFMAASGEIVTAGFEGQRVRINVYFPNKEVRFFVTASCSRV
ncbi:MAG: hypothetical protein P8M50_00075 [Paracoccaceae bacterium]|nr:hypothetical protein [Paracoccaceae bacterium]